MSWTAEIHDWRIILDANGRVDAIAGRVMNDRRGRWPDGTMIIVPRIEPGQGIGWKATVRTCDGEFSLETPWLGGLFMR
jgi:hypothetical protein